MAISPWINSDGLPVRFGADEGAVGSSGEYTSLGPRRFVEVTIPDLTLVTTSAVVVDYNVWLPKNARIETVDVETVTAATSGGSATLTIGLNKKDTTSAYDATGLVSALAKTAIATAGQYTSLTQGSTSAGTAIGTSLTEKAFITAKYTTAIFTAGKVVVRIYYSIVT